MSRHGLIAGAVAGVVGGLPSTLHAVLTGRDPLAPTRAAGTLLARADTSPGRLLLLGLLAHTVLSSGWGLVLERVLPHRRPVLWGGLAGLLIAALDLGAIGRRFPAIRSLPQIPQVGDHLLYGAVVGLALKGTESPGPSG